MRATWAEKWFYRINYLVLLLAGLTCLLPLLNIIAVSLSDESSVSSGMVGIWPKGFNFDSYTALFDGTPIIRSFKNSLIITGVGVALSMGFTILAAYPLSKKQFFARRFFTLAIVFTMLFGIPTIPAFLVNRSVGILDTYWSLWLPGLISAYNMMVLKSFFENIPEEMEEAAWMDGCGDLRILLQIVLPLSMPVLATLTLFYGVGYWNVFQSVLINISDSTKYNLSVLVQNMVQNQSLLQQLNSSLRPEELDMQMTSEGLRASGLVVLLLPLLVVYPFLQKYFVKGVMIGAVKG
ncbi:carbohydrate ABC transporter permease [Gorillibacterium sp. sgz5001074]|uniref:carbohydrate ABC transporter permease n=1 Tax=Gorillibacterium sp. sgz5001074 TaxID=3446695 RepID=UPI003F66E7C7